MICSLLLSLSGLSRVATVSSLFFHRRPPAIFHAIVSIVIDSINAVSVGWWMTHVGKKILECLPTITDGYTAVSVVQPALRTVATASAAHCFPDTINSRVRHTMLSAVVAAAAVVKAGVSMPHQPAVVGSA